VAGVRTNHPGRLSKDNNMTTIRRDIPETRICELLDELAFAATDRAIYASAFAQWARLAAQRALTEDECAQMDHCQARGHRLDRQIIEIQQKLADEEALAYQITTLEAA
jgi:hypothetical protein